jgi:hypothetical protein
MSWIRSEWVTIEPVWELLWLLYWNFGFHKKVLILEWQLIDREILVFYTINHLRIKSHSVYIYQLYLCISALYSISCFYCSCVSRVAQSVQRLATGWTVRGSNPGGGEIFYTCPDRPWGPPSLLCNWYRVFPGCRKRPGRDADPSPLLVQRSKNRVELYLYSS